MRPEEKIVLSFVDHGMVRGEFAHDIALLGMSMPGKFGAISNVRDNLIARGRNTVVKNFLAGDFDWLLMLDADQRFTVGAVQTLFEAADAGDRPIISGLYFGLNHLDDALYPLPVPQMYFKRPDTKWSYHHVMQYTENSVIQIDGCGAGFLLVHRSVFERVQEMSPPNFAEVCWFQDFPIEDNDWIGEDLAFCLRVRSCGIPIHAHTGAVSAHIKPYAISEEHFLDYRQYFERMGKPLF